MKTYIFKSFLGFFVLFASAFSPIAAAPNPSLAVPPAVCDCGPNREYTKSISRDFSTTANGTTALYNRYGTINVKTWGENRVKIDILITVNADNDRDANKAFEKIQVNFTNTAGYVKAETMIGDMGGSWWDWGNTCKDFKINYDIWMPAGNQLDLQNKFGNSFVGNLGGKLLVDIKHGDLRTEKIANDADINIQYGTATLQSVNNITGAIGYGGININEARDVQINTEYSNCTIRNANMIRMTSKYDELNFGTVDELRLQTKYSDAELISAKNAYITAQFTDFKITNIGGQLDADLSYGAFKLETLGRNFTSASFVGNFTDIYCGLERGGNCKFNITGNFSDTKLPAGANVTKRSESTSRSVHEGSIGDGGSKMIKAKLNYGGIVLR